jgi:tripartite-type tricarboxylate transporter receptor subunit TctC
LIAWSTATAFAQDYPARPVRIVVPFPPSGAADLLTRALGKRLSESWSQPVVADNRPGAGGNIGAEAVAKSAPDGYTVLMAAVTTHAVSMSLYSKLGYDLEKDLAPVSLVANVPHILVAHPSLPASNLRELLAYLKTQDGKTNFASQGNGTLSHLEFELMKSMGGFRANHIPYKGSAPALVDLLSGNVVVLFDSIPSALPQVRAGKLKAVGLTTGRSTLAPDVPPLTDAGVRGFDMDVFVALVGPAKMNPNAQMRLADEASAVARSPEMRQRFFNAGWAPLGASPEALKLRVRNETNLLGGIIMIRGIKVE